MFFLFEYIFSNVFFLYILFKTRYCYVGDKRKHFARNYIENNKDTWLKRRFN
jgi:hypothetical protein